MSIDFLLQKQNPDGGWPYVRGKSWTEPTAYAVMALHGAGESAAVDRGVRWILATQRADGGWAPQGEVEDSTWVTGLVALLPEELLGSTVSERSVQWLMAICGRETSSLHRLRQRLLGEPFPPEQKFSGWPWFPGAAAWVGPTSVAILALDKANRRRQSPAVARRVKEGQDFLLARMCQDGGWNHGSARPLGYDSRAYPETTGMALAALRGSQSEKIGRAVTAAQQFLAQTRSADAQNWLRLGLLAHNHLSADPVPAAVIARTLSEASLGMVVAQAEKGHSLLWG